MPDALSIVSETNAKLLGGFTGFNWINILGWILFVVVAGIGGFFSWKFWNDKKIYNKRITVCDIVGSYYEPVMRDVARIVKIGTGGFEILYLKKAKVYRVGYGGRVGRTDYYFYIQPDGYWYNGMMAAGVNMIDKNKGLVPIVTTNPSMRAQYTSLEKQIDHLHAEKKSFWEGNKTWIIPIMYIMAIGICGWLMYKEVGPALAEIPKITQAQAELTSQNVALIEKMNTLMNNFKIVQQTSTGGSGLVPAP